MLFISSFQHFLYALSLLNYSLNALEFELSQLLLKFCKSSQWILDQVWYQSRFDKICILKSKFEGFVVLREGYTIEALVKFQSAEGLKKPSFTPDP
jgi:hypothetical protein